MCRRKWNKGEKEERKKDGDYYYVTRVADKIFNVLVLVPSRDGLPLTLGYDRNTSVAVAAAQPRPAHMQLAGQARTQ